MNRKEQRQRDYPRADNLATIKEQLADVKAHPQLLRGDVAAQVLHRLTKTCLVMATGSAMGPSDDAHGALNLYFIKSISVFCF